MPPGLFGHDDAGPLVRVALERAIDGRAATLTYALPEDAAAEPAALVGRACTAPLGRTRARGVIIAAGHAELLDGLDPAKLRRLHAIGDARLPPAVVELGRWIADYYACPLGIALAAMLPAAVKKAVGRRTRVALRPTSASPQQPLPPAARRAWEALGAIDEADWPLDERVLARRVGAKNAAPVRRLIREGLLAPETLSEVRTRGDMAATLDESGPPPTPTNEQAAAIEGVPLGAFGVHLLFGVTGSGKTEVYLRLLQRVIDAGRTGIVLVPEIALTPQLAARFRARFVPMLGEDGVAVMHSGLNAGQRHHAWDLLARGRARIAVGPRSALFAPLENVGLIVVDEEHAGDYKQDQAPRYHGRDTAIKRAQVEGCPVVLGSATPSLESWRNAQTGRYALHRLATRPPGAAGLPTVEVVDIAEQRKLARDAGDRMQLLGPCLRSALRDTLDGGGQAVLLLNRRGFARVVACPDADCGWALSCDSCSSAMVFHRKGVASSRGLVRCHHCHAEQLLPRACPVCGRGTIRLGHGTQRLEDELALRLDLPPDAIARMDADTMARPADYAAVLRRVADGSARVLFGTQMIAKGLDFPNIRLVGVVDADTALGIADWRSHERTYQLISQVAGRAGRGDHPGRVIVQTLNPRLPAIVAAAAHDYEGFAAGELAIRERAGLPPFTRAAWIVVRDRSYERAEADAMVLADRLRACFGSGARVEGPAPAPLERTHDEHRVGVEVYARSAGDLRAGLQRLRAEHGLVSDAHVAIDVDPVAIW
ncbi:MAG: primosomal protein N' [Planctomycetota bacterium]